MSEKFETLKNAEEKLLCRTYGRYPLSVVKAKGSKLWDADGKEYVDLLAGIAVTSLGHCNDELCQVISEQAHKLWHVSNLFYQEEQLQLAENLLETAHFQKAFFCNSGAEANEAAIKLARRYMQKVKNKDAYEIITLSGCFHGRTLGGIAATGQKRFQDGFAPIPTGFKQVEYGNMQVLENTVSEHTAGILLEIIQGEGGIRPMPKEYLQAIVKLCKEKDILLIIDEVQAGLCRSGKFWAFQHYGIEPDIISSAKALANGLPMGAMLTTDKVASGFVAGSHATTFGGNALVAAVANKCIEIMKRDKLAERAMLLGNNFIKKAQDLAKELPNTIKEVRGMGLMLGIDLCMPGQGIWEELLKRGFVCNLTQNTVLRLLPALTVEEEYLDNFLVNLKDILQNLPK